MSDRALRKFERQARPNYTHMLPLSTCFELSGFQVCGRCAWYVTTLGRRRERKARAIRRAAS